jgi:hypothetical protein
MSFRALHRCPPLFRVCPIGSGVVGLPNPAVLGVSWNCLDEYIGAAGLGAPMRVCVSQRDGEETRIDNPCRCDRRLDGRNAVAAQPRLQCGSNGLIDDFQA